MSAPAVAVELPEISYFSPSFAPHLRLFRCESLRSDLTAAACARNHAEKLNEACVLCPIGAAHAGKRQPPHRSAARGRFCVRCLRTAADLRQHEGSGRLRLVGGLICVSCYNRQAEMLRGRNAKGGRPKKWSALLSPVSMVYTRDVDGVRRVGLLKLDLAVGPTEALLTACRRHDEPVSGSWTPASIPPEVLSRLASVVRCPGNSELRGWHQTDHACASCCGPVLRWVGGDEFCCASCGHSGSGSIESTCACGVADLECHRNESPGPGRWSRVLVRVRGG